MFLWCMAVIYLTVFVSLYVQIPGETYNFAACAEASSCNLSLLLLCVVLCVSLLAGNVAPRLPVLFMLRYVVKNHLEVSQRFPCS